MQIDSLMSSEMEETLKVHSHFGVKDSSYKSLNTKLVI
jgi:hypothetical protein